MSYHFSALFYELSFSAANVTAQGLRSAPSLFTVILFCVLCGVCPGIGGSTFSQQTCLPYAEPQWYGLPPAYF